MSPLSFHEILVKSRIPLYIEYNPRTNQQATGVLNTAHLGSCWILLKSEVSLNMFNPMNLVTTFAIHCLVIIQIKIAYSNFRWLVLKCTKHILNNLWSLWSLVRLQFWSISIGYHYLFKNGRWWPKISKISKAQSPVSTWGGQSPLLEKTGGKLTLGVNPRDGQFDTVWYWKYWNVAPCWEFFEAN